LPFEEILVLGESTNESGPFADDYFLCFVTRPDGRWLEASCDAEGRDELLLRLGNRLGGVFECQLCNSASFRSRIMWPDEVREHPLFEFLEPPAKTRLGALLRRLGFGPFRNVQKVARPVMAWLQSQPRTAGPDRSLDDPQPA
jgi:hypothetical protein